MKLKRDITFMFDNQNNNIVVNFYIISIKRQIVKYIYIYIYNTIVKTER